LTEKLLAIFDNWQSVLLASGPATAMATRERPSVLISPEEGGLLIDRIDSTTRRPLARATENDSAARIPSPEPP
jgi:hypothetical protein